MAIAINQEMMVVVVILAAEIVVGVIQVGVIQVGVIQVGVIQVGVTVVAEIQGVHRVPIGMSPVVKIAFEGAGQVVADRMLGARIVGGEMKVFSHVVALQVETAETVVTVADVVAGIEDCRVAIVDRFSLRLKSLKAHSKVFSNCTTAATDFCAIRRKIMQLKIPIRLFPVHSWKNTSSARGF